MELTQPRNPYTQRWFTAFLGRIDPIVVAKVMLFLETVLPRHEFGRVLDVCCGVGRHVIPLSEAGHSVVALDRSESAIRVVGQARSQNGAHTPTAVVGDMCALPIRTSSVDAIINMWQSFGQFDSEANRRVLAEWARGLRPGGRLVLDLYHRAYHERNVGTRRIVRDDVEVMEVRSVEHGRLRVTLTYVVANTDDDAGKSNEFEWQLYSPGELADAAAPAGLNLDRVCTEFDVKLSPTNESPRMQVVFVKAA